MLDTAAATCQTEPTPIKGDTAMSNATHGYETVAYRARSAADVARILKRHRVTEGARRVAAQRAFHRDGHVVVAIPAGRLVINRKGAR